MDIDFHNPDLTNALIMMVDDEPINMEVVQALLEDAGYKNFILEEQSVRAMETLEQHQPDILLLDLMMPGKDGFELLAEIRQHANYQHLPVLVLTSADDTESRLRVLKLGATDLISKPVDPTELILRVHNTLSSKSYLDKMAYYDPDTHLPNGRMFSQQFDWALKKSERHGDRLAILNISIDDYDRINAAIGQEAGADLLRQVALLMKSAVRDSDVYTSVGEQAGLRVANLYRNESAAFMLLLERINRAEDAALVAQRIIKTVNQPLNALDKEICITCSIGIVTYPEEGNDPTTLIRLVNTARDYVKNKGGNAFQFSSSVIDLSYRNRLDMESQLRKALERDELELHYQPKVDLQTGRICGAEALLRWFNGKAGMVSPMEFIPIAEETGLIIPIGRWVLETSCHHLKRWSEICDFPFGISANVSARQFQEPNFLNELEIILEQTHAPASNLTLEITESLLMEDVEQSIELMNQLRKLSLKLSIDDFGTGYSSLAYLKNIPVDELKIDRSFIMDVPEKQDACAIVSTIIYLARKLGFHTVAEGIETKEQLEFLRNEQCEQFQGFYFSKPLPASEMTKMLLEQQKQMNLTDER